MIYEKKLQSLNFCIRISVVLLFVFLSSCKKEKGVTNPKDANSLQEIFLLFWEKMNIQYVYWDKERLDWNSIYKQYQPLFSKLNKNDDDDKRKAASYFKQMTATFIDNHFKISFQDTLLAGVVIDPSFERKIKSDNYHARYNYEGVVWSYLDEGFLSENGKVNQNGKLINVTAGTINKNILYFHCNFFSLKKSYEASDGNKVKHVLDYFFSELKRTPNPINGIIIDLRNNSGGNVADLNFLAGKLVTQDVLFGYSRSKSGLGRLSYQPWLESKLRHDPDYNVIVPIILLGDNFTASLSEIIILALRSKKNLFIGEQTYGATGAVSDSEVFNSGSFSVNKFLTVTTSSVEFKGPDGAFYEGIGITPDRYSPFNLHDLSLGKDAQLEFAISQIN
jgi:hypothetical protein